MRNQIKPSPVRMGTNSTKQVARLYRNDSIMLVCVGRAPTAIARRRDRHRTHGSCATKLPAHPRLADAARADQWPAGTLRPGIPAAWTEPAAWWWPAL
jgi:hypothetical protein